MIIFAQMCFLAFLLCAAAEATPRPVRLFVSPQGDDDNTGTLRHPFRTLRRAQDEIRRRKKTGKVTGPVVVEFAGGRYELDAPVKFTAEDSGTPTHPIEYRARRGRLVRLVGGRVVTGWRLVTDPRVLARLDPAARGKVYQANLKAQGVSICRGSTTRGPITRTRASRCSSTTSR